MSFGFHLVTGNCLETLSLALARVICSGSANVQSDPFVPETVLVQSKGMQRWLSLEIARINGICANIRFPFPNTFIDTLYRDICGTLPDKRLFDTTLLTFRILDALPDLLDTPAFNPLRTYLQTRRHPMKAYQLARRIADTFDQYLVFRTDMIAQWEQGNDALAAEGQSWQPILWRYLRRPVADPHRADLQKRLIDRLGNSGVPDIDLKKLPHRIAIFGISHLPQFHLTILKALSKQIPVYLFLLNPCRHFWFDILSDRQLSNRRSKHASPRINSEDMHFERGNRLLASWGQIGKHFFNSVYQLQDQSVELFQENEQRTLLSAVQNDILDLIDRSDNSNGANKTDSGRSHAADGSIRIHACHGPMREVQVLHDQLLDMFERDPTLHPRDILVLMPDIAGYAPYIHAVFGSARPRIPFSIADQSFTCENRIAEGFTRLLNLAAHRFEASKVISLLEYPAIRKRFGLKAIDLPLVEKWIELARIRWGWDGQDRKKHSLPGFNENTWRFGLDRLLLGYAMDGNDQSLFGGILPANAAEGGEAVLLGGFVNFCEALHKQFEHASRQRDMQQWGAYFRNLLDRFFTQDETTAPALQEIRDVLSGFDTIVDVAECKTPVDYDVAVAHLVEQLDARVNSAGFLAGRLTFCAMLPMRSIPAKVVCLLGLNHDAFPKESHVPGFDLIALDPRPGDRSRRNDDKYLFLESIISARNTLYLSYIGKDIQDNGTIPPSVLVEEFIEYLADNYGFQRTELVVEHPLHAFSPRYFSNAAHTLFSFSEENLQASLRMASPRQEPAFFSAPLPPPEEKTSHALDSLIRFFANPCRFLLEERLGLYLHNSASTTEDRELFHLDPLNRFILNQRLLASSLEGELLSDTLAVMRASGDLPHGSVGKAAYRQSCAMVSSFESRLEKYLPDDPPRRLRLSVSVGQALLDATVDGVHDTCLITYRMAKMRPKDLVSFFLNFLTLCASVHGAPVKRGFYVFQNETWEFQRPADALPQLGFFMNLYREGMQVPLPFFQQTSHTYANHVINRSASRETALNASRQTWEGTDFRKGEKDDPYFAKCFGHADPLTDQFEKTALALWNPVFEAGRKLPAGL